MAISGNNTAESVLFIRVPLLGLYSRAAGVCVESSSGAIHHSPCQCKYHRLRLCVMRSFKETRRCHILTSLRLSLCTLTQERGAGRGFSETIPSALMPADFEIFQKFTRSGFP